MHEAAIAEGLLDVLRQRLPPGARVLKLHIVAEPLAGVERECLLMWLETMTAGTPIAGVQVDLEIRAATLTCTACAATSRLEPGRGVPLACAACGGGLRLEGGSRVWLESAEIEEGDETP